MGAGFNDRLATQDLGLMPFLANDGSNVRYRLVAGTWNRTVNTAYLLGTLVYYAGSTLGDGIEIDFYGSTFGRIAMKTSNSGIVDLYIDGTVAVSGIDLYAAIQQNSQLVALLTNLTPGKHTAKILLAGKNVSSSAYNVYLEATLVESINVCITGCPLQPVNVMGWSAGTLTTQPSRASSNTAFWNAAAVAAGGVSVAVGYVDGRIRILVNVSAATDITVQHSADNTNWYDGEVLSFTAAGTKTLVVDCCYYVRLKSSAAATITADYIYLKG